MTKKTKNKYNHYTEDFRREAVRRSEGPDTSAAEVARELGIHPGQIYNWRRQYKRLSDKQFIRWMVWIILSKKMKSCVN